MNHVFRTFVLPLLLAAASCPLHAQAASPASPPATSPAPAAAAGAVKQLGSIRKLGASSLTLATDQGTEVAVNVLPGARIVRFAADLKSAAPIPFAGLQVGDRVLVRGSLAADGVSIEAAVVSVLKQQDIAQRQQQELLDWQRRGVGGLVQQVDPQAASITLSVSAAGSSRTVVVATTAKTSFKRYAPESVKWDDASAATLGDIHPGDQLRAMGTRSDDGSQLAAEAIVAGTFRNISGLVTAVDAAAGTMTVADLASKKPVTVKITADSQMKNLPPQLAQGLAMRLKGAASSASPSATPPATSNTAAPADPARPRAGDLNQMLARLPAITLADLHKGDAVMIVGTEGSVLQPPVAITLLGGVEPILTAAPAGKGTESFLTPWSLASAPGGDQQ
jgi:hypothetical protein